MANAKTKKWNAHIALAFCKTCRGDLVSPRGGIFKSCECGESFIDQERFGGLYVRLGGDAEFIEQICPPDCKIKQHKTNDKNTTTSKPKPNIKAKGQKRKAIVRNKRA